MVASPQPLSGPTGVIKWLQNYSKDSTGNTREWEVGFTPYRPEFDQATGELRHWVAPSGLEYRVPCYEPDDSTGKYVSGQDKLTTLLPDDKTVSLTYHPYSTTFTYTGFESGEDWYGRIPVSYTHLTLPTKRIV